MPSHKKEMIPAKIYSSNLIGGHSFSHLIDTMNSIIRKLKAYQQHKIKWVCVIVYVLKCKDKEREGVAYT